MNTFKQLVAAPNDEERWTDFLHHIAEEELVACIVKSVDILKRTSGTLIIFKVDCNDKPRGKGAQRDLTLKLKKRLQKHNFLGLGTIDCRVLNLGGSKNAIV